MDGRNATIGGDGGREMTVYVCWEGFVEEGVGRGGSYVTKGEGKIACG